MICIRLQGGLGNQMFQYALGRKLSYERDVELVLDTSLLKSKRIDDTTRRSFELEIFEIKGHEATKNELGNVKPLLSKIENSLALKFKGTGLQKENYFVENQSYFDKSIDKVGENCYLMGYWQSYRYFDSVESLIRQDFRFRKNLDKKSNSIANNIRNDNSISIHIRRTDYVNNSNHSIHGVCSLEYYMEAIEFITKNVSSPIFYIFSDDIEWARSNLRLNFKCEYISGNYGSKSYIDMQLMSLCKHNIIANSSFSWWGAWLNENTDKIVIAPKKWFKDEKRNSMTSDLIPEDWIRL